MVRIYQRQRHAVLHYIPRKIEPLVSRRLATDRDLFGAHILPIHIEPLDERLAAAQVIAEMERFLAQLQPSPVENSSVVRFAADVKS